MSEETQTSTAGKNKPRQAKWLRWVLLILALIVLVLAAAGAWMYWAFQPVAGAKQVEVTVNRGESIAQIANDLKSKHLIRSSLAFKLYTRFTHTGVSIRAGQYQLEQGTRLKSLVQELKTGEGLTKSIKVTIPEGYTVQQIAARLQQDGICTQQAFLNQVQHGTFTESFFNKLPHHANVRYRLEGYLFPDTYEFVKHESAHKVVNEMLQNFQNHVQADLSLIQHKHMTLWKVVTEASLVEREAKVEKERPIIASVINNRLNHTPPMKLQIDATIEYVLGHTNIVTDKELKVKSPYNTYLHLGLPPGPIASPGLKSIEAVINPAKTQYLYYVVKNNGSGEHYFAKTYKQQLHNEQLSQANLKKYS